MLRPEESNLLMNDPAIRRVLHGQELHDIFAELFGEPAISLDYKWFRAVIPDQYSGFHMDNVCKSCVRARKTQDQQQAGADPPANSRSSTCASMNMWHATCIPWRDACV